MATHKKPRERGKFSYTKYFQEFEAGESVAVVRELSVKFGYSNRIQGRTGKILGKRGTAYMVKLNDLGKEKIYLIKPIHLKKIMEVKS